MSALTIISALMYSKAGSTKLETATNVLVELKSLRKNKKLPFLVVRRAIKIQENLIKDM